MTLTISREQLERARQALKEQRIELLGDAGGFTAKGCSIDYCYEEASGVLTVNVISWPFLVSKEHVETKVREWFNA